MKKTLAGGSFAIWLAVSAFGLTFTAAPASAATIDFGSGTGDDPYVEDGFSFDPSRIVGGPCSPDAPCLALNDNEFSVMTFTGSVTGLFDLISLNFNLLGNGTVNILTVFETDDDTNTISFSVADFLKNTYHFFDLGTQFLNVSSITFFTPDGGNVRIDDVVANSVRESNPVVPLPAALPLLLGGLGGLAWISRRQKRRSRTVA